MSAPRKNARRELPIYVIKRDGVKHYLLGTQHNLSLQVLEEFPENISKIVKSLVVEVSTDCKYTKAECIEAGFLISPDQKQNPNETKSWVAELSLENQEKFRKAAVKFFKRILPSFGQELENLETANTALNQIDLGWAFFIYTQKPPLMESLLRKKLEAIPMLGLESTERLQFFRCLRMDSLTVSDFEQYLDFLEFPEEDKEITDDHDENKNESYADLKQDFNLHLNVDIRRNLKWLHMIMVHHQSLKGPVLFAVGVAHLEYSLGLLELLSKCGFRIFRINTALEEQEEFKPAVEDSKDLELGIRAKLENKFEEYAKACMQDILNVKASQQQKNSSQPRRNPGPITQIILSYTRFSIFDNTKFLRDHMDLDQQGEPVITTSLTS